MTRHLVVGDMHVVRSELKECNKMIEFIKSILDSDPTIEILDFMGDQTNNHSSIDAYVMDFWQKSLEWLIARSREKTPLYINLLVGNHDMANPKDASTVNSMELLESKRNGIHVISRPTHKYGILYVPYTHNIDSFVQVCKNYPKTPTVFCHQSFNGAKYENGFPIQDGVEVNLIPQSKVISGHIHNFTKLGKIVYVGSPRWRTILDANQPKGVHIVDVNDNGMVIDFQTRPTDNVVTPIYAFMDTEEDPVFEDALPKSGTIFIDVYGSYAYVNERKKSFPKHYKIRTYINKIAQSSIKESDGIDVAMSKWVDSYKPKLCTKEELKQFMESRK